MSTHPWRNPTITKARGLGDGYGYIVEVPESTHEDLVAYIETGRPAGGFVGAVLSNDLRGSVQTADDEHQALLVEIVSWLYNRAPARCWGSPDAVAAWREHRGMEGIS